MITRHTILCSALLLGLVLPTPAEPPPQDRKIVDFQLFAGTNESFTLTPKAALPLSLNDTLDLGTNSSLLKVDVDVGRITVDLQQGVARSINLNLEGVAPEIPTIPAPITPPFQRAGPTKLSQTAP